jgi:hypothetical protein
MTISVIRRRPTLADLTPFVGAETRDDKVRRAVSTRLDREARADNTPAREYAGAPGYSGAIPTPAMRVRSDAKHTGRAGVQVRASQDRAFALAGEIHGARERAEVLSADCATARNRAAYQVARDTLRAHCARYGLPFAPPARGERCADRSRFVVWG